MKIGRLLLFLLIAFPLIATDQSYDKPMDFTEVWAYLMKGEETYLRETYPVSDIGYFGAGLTMFGKLTGVPDRGKIRDFNGRVHLVVAETGNFALTHFCLDPRFELRNSLIYDIVAAAEPFDGVQIDFEAVPAQDKAQFIEFLAVLKAALGNKPLSVALPARWKEVGDSYDYALIEPIVDRILVMAYDEHWSTSVPGPIASIEWCRKVAQYALEKIGNEKLIMGLPFYGRAWVDGNPAKAYKHSGVARILSEKIPATIDRSNQIPFFEYQETVKVRVFYEDAVSLSHRLRLYENASVDKVGFWRLGQEDADVWSFLRLGTHP